MGAASASCSVCSRSFEVRFRYQTREDKGRFVHVCSHTCHTQSLGLAEAHECSVCAKSFELELAYQVVSSDAGPRYYCTHTCRELGERMPRSPSGSRAPTGARRIAVFNHKGGTGKTTTAVNLAAGLVERGHRVLLVDADGQGNVGASLGIAGERTLYHVLVHGASVEEAVVPVRDRFDVLTSNESLAAAELSLATKPNRARILRERLGHKTDAYDYVVVDCAPALSLLNQNALLFAESVLVPVSCDYLSLVGVRQVLRTLKNVAEMLHHQVDILGVVPTFYDVRNRISREAVDALSDHFGERCLRPIRVNTKLREAPSVRKSIFEYAPDSHGALDYRALVDAVVAPSARISQVGESPAAIRRGAFAQVSLSA